MTSRCHRDALFNIITAKPYMSTYSINEKLFDLVNFSEMEIVYLGDPKTPFWAWHTGHKWPGTERVN